MGITALHSRAAFAVAFTLPAPTNGAPSLFRVEVKP